MIPKPPELAKWVKLSNIINSAKEARIGDFCKTFEPMLYATWKQLKQDNDLYLKAWNTQRSIADIIGETHQSISNIIDLAKKDRIGDFGQIFEPFIYNIWNLHKAKQKIYCCQ